MFRRLPSEARTNTNDKVLTKGCKDCENQFRQNVLIDRLVRQNMFQNVVKFKMIFISALG